jgi:hypothetical protein
MLTTWHPLTANVGNYFADKRRSLGRYSSLVDSDHGGFFCLIRNIRLSVPISERPTAFNWDWVGGAEYIFPVWGDFYTDGGPRLLRKILSIADI